MNIYLLEVSNMGYDTYDGFVVYAKTKKRAKKIAEAEAGTYANGADFAADTCLVTKIGVTTKKNVKEGRVLGSFNAG